METSRDRHGGDRHGGDTTREASRGDTKREENDRNNDDAEQSPDGDYCWEMLIASQSREHEEKFAAYAQMDTYEESTKECSCDNTNEDTKAKRDRRAGNADNANDAEQSKCFANTGETNRCRAQHCKDSVHTPPNSFRP